ncbi:DUF418 domain-containing protein [Robiginitalea sp. IMCC44478]|uniref:DUF418 domain-containing protein n=1 Tax=Robiginitalea sp. IMCC44478 TaxID=3459122 RepID=UPI004041E453
MNGQISGSTKQRLAIVDALRGFSLAGIVIVHMVENYIGGPAPEEAFAATTPGIIDQVVNVFIFIFLRGKFFALFSFLFGLSFFLQMDSANARGESFALRFAWRLSLLLVIGYLHHLFYRGDILTIYALLGLLLIPFYRIKSGWILALAGLLFLGIGRYAIFWINKGPDLLMEDLINPNNPLILSYYELLQNGSLWEVFRSNATSGHLMKVDFQVGIFGRGYLTFAFFLIGLWVGRIKFFRNFRDYREKIWLVFWISLGVFLVGTVLMGVLFSQMGSAIAFDSWKAMFALTAMDLSNLGMTALIVCSFVLLFTHSRLSKFLNSFAAYGRMALTNYVAQSLLGTFIFYGWGLGYLTSIRNSYVFLIALLIIGLQMGLSKVWLQRFYYGPLEWAWRSLTFFRAYPMKRK